MLKPNESTDNKNLQLEDLLRFKQAERPDAAYWSRFDRELHQGMLHTLVKKDPLYPASPSRFHRKVVPGGHAGHCHSCTCNRCRCTLYTASADSSACVGLSAAITGIFQCIDFPC